MSGNDLENMGDTLPLFDLGEFSGPGPARQYVTQADRAVSLIRDMEMRELKNLSRKLIEGRTLTAAEAERLSQYRARFGAEAGVDLPDGVVKTQREVAEHFGKNIRTIKRWCGYGMPRGVDTYNLADIRKWALENGYLEAGGEDLGHGDTLDDAAGTNVVDINSKSYHETELKRVQAALKKLEYDKAMGLLLPADEVKQRDLAKITETKRALLGLPRAVAPRLTGLETREIEAVLMEHVREILIRFAGQAEA